MRGFNKFLFKNKWHVFCFFFKKRILRFKRPKWKHIQSRISFTKIHYKKYISKIITLQFLKFLKYLFYLKKKIKKKQIFKKKYIYFFKKLNSFLITNYFQNIKRNLIFKLKFPYIKQKFFFKKNFKNFFFHYNRLSISHYISRSRFLFKNLLFMKSIVLKYFYGCIKIKSFKKIPKTYFYKDNLIFMFIKPEFRLDILLWRLQFFKSPYLARFAFQKNLININYNLINFSYFLKNHYKRCLNGYELISLNLKLKYFFKRNLNLYIKSLNLCTFLEIDYYLGNIILLKPLSRFSYRDINSILKEPLCVYKFKDYIFK